MAKEKWCEAEVNRIAGKIALLSLEPDAARTEECFERALAVARARHSRAMLIAARNSQDFACFAHSRLRRLKLHTIRHLDGRSIAARRAKAVVRELTQALGGTVSPMQLQAIECAAMHVVIAEDFAARRLAGEPVSLDETLRAEGVARRSVQAILANRPE